MTDRFPTTCDASLLGANWKDGEGTSFRVSVNSAATEVALILFSEPGGREYREIRMKLEGEWQERDGNDYCVCVPDAKPGDEYGFRVFGPWDPQGGLLFDPNRLLVDPAGRLLSSRFCENPVMFGKSYVANPARLSDEVLDGFPRSVIGHPSDFDWGEDKPLGLQTSPWDYVFYETPIRGATIRISGDLLGAKPGTYRAIASDHYIEKLKRLGITVLELYVFQQSLPGYRGDWGYNPLCLGAPDWQFAENGADSLSVEREFKQMVKRLHEAGIMVCLDVVFNHTVEGNNLGPNLSLKGLDNFCYWLCDGDGGPNSKEFYLNWSGCGNALNFDYPPVRRLSIELLRRLVVEYHIDLFRFDLMAVQFAHYHGCDEKHEFRVAFESDPVLSQIPLNTGEPWMCGKGDRCALPKIVLPAEQDSEPSDEHLAHSWGRNWALWSDDYRDTMRQFWLGQAGKLGAFVDCLAGRRRFHPPEEFGWWYSLSGIWFHDGFNAEQWLRHDDKSNVDGHGDNHSSNWGAEGIPEDPELAAQVEEIRWRVWKAAMASLVFSPLSLIRAGDERRYYPGSAHNNIYCAGDEANGIDHECNPGAFDYTRGLLALRHRIPNLGRIIFEPFGLTEDEEHPFGCYQNFGLPMSENWWEQSEAREVSLYLPGAVDADSQSSGNIVLMFNGYWEPVTMTVPDPAVHVGGVWKQILDSGAEDPFEERVVREAKIALGKQSVVLLLNSPV